MQKISESTVKCPIPVFSVPLRITRLAKALSTMVCLALIYVASGARGATPPASHSLTLAWDRSPSPDVTGYRVYYGGLNGIYTNFVWAGNVTTNTISGLINGAPYYFVVTAFSASGVESLPSNEVSYVPGLPGLIVRVMPAAQVVLTISGLINQAFDIEATSDFKNWSVIGNVTLNTSSSVDFTDTSAANYPRRFYRTVLKP